MSLLSLWRFLSWRALLRFVVALLVVYGIVVGLLLRYEDRLVFHPRPAIDREEPAGFPVRDLALPLEDGTSIHGRWYPCAGARRAVLLCHSRSGNLSRELRPVEIALWHEAGLSILIFDYPGYGRSEGKPSESGCYAAAGAAYHWLTRIAGVAAEDVVICGRSLGTAVAVDLASRRPHGVLVLVAPLTSLPEVALSYFPLLPAKTFMRNRFDSLAKIGRCTRPIFIVHGTRDSVVPFAQGKQLFAAANEPKRFLTVEGGRHGVGASSFFPALKGFLRETGLFGNND
jgi:fermentation-respiration switch protein FrsA (DUF1100 family)